MLHKSCNTVFFNWYVDFKEEQRISCTLQLDKSLNESKLKKCPCFNEKDCSEFKNDIEPTTPPVDKYVRSYNEAISLDNKDYYSSTFL